jgi:hypothetical protein
MNRKMTAFILMAALMSLGVRSWADDVNATGNNNDPLKHPVNAYTNHEVKEDMQESTENNQKAKEAKAEYKQAKADYEKSLKDSGAKSEITVAAKKRMADARSDMHKYYKKTTQANSELKKDATKAQQ